MKIKNNINRPFQSKLLYNSWLNTLQTHNRELQTTFSDKHFPKIWQLYKISTQKILKFRPGTKDLLVKALHCTTLTFINLGSLSSINHVLSFFFTTKQKWVKLMKKLSYVLQIKFDLRVS